MGGAGVVKDREMGLADCVRGDGAVGGINVGGWLGNSDRAEVGNVGYNESSGLGVDESDGVQGKVSSVGRGNGRLRGGV